MDRGAADHVGAVGEAGLAVADRRNVPERVDVRVDAARDDDLAGGVDHAARLIVGEGAGARHGGDGLALNADVPGAGALRRHHLVAANDQIEHVFLPKGSGALFNDIRREGGGERKGPG